MLSTRIAEVGNLSEVSFARKTIELQKIRNMEVETVRQGLGMIFVRAVNLLAIKQKISQINKDDIRDMILIKFKNLSLEEIDYAFKHDRWSGNPIDHYQLFNSEYVAKVLTRYKKWLRETRYQNNLPLQIEKKKPEPTEVEKQKIIDSGIIDCFEEYKAHKKIPMGRVWVYDYLYEKKLLPAHTQKFREKIKRNAIKKFYKKSEVEVDRTKELKSVLKKIQTGKRELKVFCKVLVLEEYFNRLIAQEKQIIDQVK